MENIDVRRFLNIEPQNSRQINVISILSFTLVLNSGFSINFKETDYCGKYQLSTSQNLWSSLWGSS